MAVDSTFIYVATYLNLRESFRFHRFTFVESLGVYITKIKQRLASVETQKMYLEWQLVIGLCELQMQICLSIYPKFDAFFLLLMLRMKEY
jgi:hypothetical protein